MRITENAVASLSQTLVKLETATRSLAASNGEPDQTLQDTVDLSGQAVTLIRARREFQANARVVAAQDELERKALDLLG